MTHRKVQDKSRLSGTSSRKWKREISEFKTLSDFVWREKGTWNPQNHGNPRFLHFWGGYNPYIGGLKLSCFMVLGPREFSQKWTPSKVLRLLFLGDGKRNIWLFFSNFLICKGFEWSEYRIFKTNLSQIQIWAHDIWSCDGVLFFCCNAAAGFKATLHEKSDTPP